MIEDIQSIRVNILYGEENKTNSLKAYKAECEMKKAINSNKEELIKYFGEKHNIQPIFNIKKPDSSEKDEYSLIELINNKLTDTSIKVCLDAYDVFQKHGIILAIERIHLQSSLNII